jgi:hypothetical protein
MRLPATALAAALMTATLPSLTVRAEGAWGVYHCGYCYGDSGFGYEVYGCTAIYSYSWYREHRCTSHRDVRRHAAVRGVRRARSFNSAAAASSSGLATTGSPSLSSPSVSLPSVSSPSTSTVEPAPAAKQLSSTATKLPPTKVDATNTTVSESEIQRKLADTEADLKQAKAEAGRAAKEAQQAKADAQVALQSKAEAEHKLAESEATEKRKLSQTDPLGTWLRGLGAWLRVVLFGPPNPENP